VVVSWTWGGGWLGANGFVDFAGSGIVHMVGGVAGLVGAAIVGPRHGKEKNPADKKNILEDAQYIEEKKKRNGGGAEFEQWVLMREKEPFVAYSFPFVAMGTIILWVSWLFFNGGSAFSMESPRKQGVPKIIMNTIIAAAAGGAIATTIKPHIMGTYGKYSRYDVSALCNGILGGLVSITAPCYNVQPWGAFLIGLIGGVIYAVSCKLLKLWNIDDPVEAAAVHGFCGAWGLIAVGLFDNDLGLFHLASGAGKFFGY